MLSCKKNFFHFTLDTLFSKYPGVQLYYSLKLKAVYKNFIHKKTVLENVLQIESLTFGSQTIAPPALRTLFSGMHTHNFGNGAICVLLKVCADAFAGIFFSKLWALSLARLRART